MNTQQTYAWLLYGGGMKLWEELYSQFNLLPFPGGNTGCQMGGWFNREINSIADLKGLKIRMPGLGGKVISRAGASSVLVAGGEIYTNLERGVIDATEWLGPYHDYLMGFQDVARYYYTPGWHEPGSALDFFFNKEKMEDLPSDIQMILKHAALSVNHWVLSRFEYENARYMQKILQEKKVQVRQWPREVLTFLKEKSRIVLEEEAQKDTLSSEVYYSYKNFLASSQKWSHYSEESYHEL
jgi:TRAP-type mannitol/chloroaromatic compound transport system substrate-binding protein